VQAAGDQAHFASRLAGADDAQEARLFLEFDSEGTQPPGPQEMQFIRRFAGTKKVASARQAPPPSRAGLAGGLEEPGKGGSGG
jgi:hypothetical protein